MRAWTSGESLFHFAEGINGLVVVLPKQVDVAGGEQSLLQVRTCRRTLAQIIDRVQESIIVIRSALDFTDREQFLRGNFRSRQRQRIQQAARLFALAGA